MEHRHTETLLPEIYKKKVTYGFIIFNMRKTTVSSYLTTAK